MSFPKIVTLAVVLCLTAASAVFADQDRRRGRDRDGRGGRVVVRPRVVARPPIVHRRAVPRYYAPRAHYWHRSRGWYAPVHRPGLGFGIYIGTSHYYRAYRPVPYVHRAYAAPIYGYPYAYDYGYPSYAAGAIYAAPPLNPSYGGVRLDVTPRDAAVHVDGYYAGIVDDFDGTWQRVALAPGPHRIEIAAPGYEPVSFEVNVLPSQTVRYRADLSRLVP